MCTFLIVKFTFCMQIVHKQRKLPGNASILVGITLCTGCFRFPSFQSTTQPYYEQWENREAVPKNRVFALYHLDPWMSRTIIGSNCIDDDDAFIYLHALNLASVMLQGTSRDVSTLWHMIICHCPEFMMLVSKVADFYFHFLSTRCCNAQRLKCLLQKTRLLEYWTLVHLWGPNKVLAGVWRLWCFWEPSAFCKNRLNVFAENLVTES